MSIPPRWSLTLFGLLLAFMMPGCSSTPSDQPDLGTVSGTVTLDGQPLSGANVVFKPETGRPSAGLTDEAGHYELIYVGETRGAMIGPHSISITTAQPASSEEESNLVEETIPAQYNTESTLTEEVKAGENVFDFQLTSN